MLREFIKEVDKNIIDHGTQIIESYEHWSDRFENGLFVGLRMQRW